MYTCSYNTPKIKINNRILGRNIGKKKKEMIPNTTVYLSDVYKTLYLSSRLNVSPVRAERYQYIWNLASSFTGQPQDLFYLLLCCHVEHVLLTKHWQASAWRSPCGIYANTACNGLWLISLGWQKSSCWPRITIKRCCRKWSIWNLCW